MVSSIVLIAAGFQPAGRAMMIPALPGPYDSNTIMGFNAGDGLNVAHPAQVALMAG
jgi:hypothetical protein